MSRLLTDQIPWEDHKRGSPSAAPASSRRSRSARSAGFVRSAGLQPCTSIRDRHMRRVNGLHHITAIAGPAQENLDFYAGVLGMRLVKKSVNQDDPGHLSPVLCRRRRAARHRPDVLSVGADGAARASGMASPSRSASKSRPAASTTGATRLEKYGARIEADRDRASAIACCRSSIRTGCASRSSSRGRRAPCVHAVGPQPRSGRASGSRPLRRADLGARRDARPRVSDRSARLHAARQRGRLDALRLRRRARASSTSAKRPTSRRGAWGVGQRPPPRVARRRRGAPAAVRAQVEAAGGSARRR